MKEKAVELLDRIFAVAGAFLFSQIPQVYQQYTLLLSGHLAELSYQVAAMENAAKSTGKTLLQLIQKFLSASDPDFYNQGILMNRTFERWNIFSEATLAFKEATFLNRPFVFIKYLDWQLLKETLSQLSVGFSLTIESLIYAIIGLFFGYLLFQLLANVLRLKAEKVE
ncbi:MAG: DUF2937 family protein [Parachlamydiaceae bacterium]